MKNQKIETLQNELEVLTKRFNDNMKKISSLLKFTKEHEHFSNGISEVTNFEKAINERLLLIKENFQINWARVDIIRQLKDSQNKICSLERSERNGICSGDFFENWKEEYENKGDFLMVEIIDILNN
ncbi:MAG: hypothetical protein RH860_05825 [Cytophagales bacterium]